MPRLSMPDLRGEFYLNLLAKLHRVLQPATYMEIGTAEGASLAISQCPSIAIDPSFAIAEPAIFKQILLKPELHLFQMKSDSFFSRHSVKGLLNAKLDMVFLDGMHRCEFLLRDFHNAERNCKRNSVIAIHDCFPVDVSMASRVAGAVRPHSPHREGWWTGDVWRTALLLKRHRRDLDITCLDAAATGLVLITNLTPESTYIPDNYAALVREMGGWSLEEIGLDQYFQEMQVESTEKLQTDDQITARFWCG
jgi:hypothetical protein